MTARFARIPLRAAGVRLGAQDFRVLICIAAHANGEGMARPSQGRIAWITGIRRSHVADAIARLERAGLLRRNRHRSASGDWEISEYEILFDDGVGVFPPQGVGVPCSWNRDVPSSGTGVFPPAGQGCSPYGDTEQSHRTESENKGRDAPRAESDFDKFWKAYPPRGPHPNPKKPARLKFEAAVKDGTDPDTIIRAARAYARYAETITDRSKVTQALTWLSQERYADEPAKPEPVTLRVGMI